MPAMDGVGCVKERDSGISLRWFHSNYMDHESSINAFTRKGPRRDTAEGFKEDSVSRSPEVLHSIYRILFNYERLVIFGRPATLIFWTAYNSTQAANTTKSTAPT